ncbi:MAG: hypothetical protein V8Q83_09695 [Blautia sp.]
MMKNPLLKRLPKELKTDLGKYLVIFLFMTLTIGFVSGFLVAGSSMSAAYDESFEKYNIEDGNFTLSSKASQAQLERLEKEGVGLKKASLWKKMQTQILTGRQMERCEFTRTGQA